MAMRKLLALQAGWQYEKGRRAVRGVVAKIVEKSPEALVASSSTSLNFENVVVGCTGLPKRMPKWWAQEVDKGLVGQDAWFMKKFKDTFVVGVADGVGRWHERGVDSSTVSRRIMKECEKLVESGKFDAKNPVKLLDSAFNESAKAPRPTGSSTACILFLQKNRLYSANLGDSGFIVVRNGKIIARSKEQVHDFNVPFQLSFPLADVPFCVEDDPKMADRKELLLEKRDVILLATDGIWDNLEDEQVLEQLMALDPEEKNVQEVCNSLVLTAHKFSKDFNHMSPFNLKGFAAGIFSRGGKAQDITSVVMLIT